MRGISHRLLHHLLSCSTVSAAALIVLGTCCSAAHASSVSRFGDIIVYEGSLFAPSDLHVSQTQTHLVFRERDEPVLAFSGCEARATNEAGCDHAGIDTIVLFFGVRNDEVSATAVALPMLVRGGLGRDVLDGGQQRDEIRGDDGNDRVDGGGGDDVVTGGHGDDELAGSEGDDLLVGGSGDDRILGLDGGSDVIDCGTGIDTARVGSSDQLQLECDLATVGFTQIAQCDPGTAATGLKPKLPKRPARRLRVKVTSASVPVVIVSIRIWFKSPVRSVVVNEDVRTNGKWKFVRRVSSEYTGSVPDPDCPI